MRLRTGDNIDSDARLEKAIADNIASHVWAVDADGVCEYDTGYACLCGTTKLAMAEGDITTNRQAQSPCPIMLDPGL